MTDQGREYKTGPCIHGDPCRESMCVEYGRWDRLAASATDEPKDTLRAAAQAVVDATANWHLPTTVGGARLSGALIALRSALAASATDEGPDCGITGCVLRPGHRGEHLDVSEAGWVAQRARPFAASATDEPTRLDVALDSYGAGWSDAARLAASATDERPLLHDCAHCRNVRKLAASATERRCGVRATPCRFDRADWCVVHRSYAALAAPATDEPKPIPQ